MNAFSCDLSIDFFLEVLPDREFFLVFFLLYVFFFIFKPPPNSPVLRGLCNRHLLNRLHRQMNIG